MYASHTAIIAESQNGISDAEHPALSLSNHRENSLFTHPQRGWQMPAPTSLTPKTHLPVLGLYASLLYEMIVSRFNSTWDTSWINQSESGFESGTAGR